MDENVSLVDVETSKSKKSINYHLFIKKTLQFLVPVSLLSFFLTYASGFSLSFIFTYNFHFSTLVFPFFSHALERKYMFLICNGILAFLSKTLRFNSSSSSVIDESMKTTEDNAKPTSETLVMEEVEAPFQEIGTSSQYSTANVALEPEKEEKEVAAGEKVYVTEEEGEAEVSEEGKEDKLQSGCHGNVLIIENEDCLYSEDEQEDYETEESATALLGGSAAEEGNEIINLNTEELNQKFEEFIRKMKEEIRIEAQQQLVVA